MPGRRRKLKSESDDNAVIGPPQKGEDHASPNNSELLRSDDDVHRTKNIIASRVGELTGATTPDGVKDCAAEASRMIAAEQRIVFSRDVYERCDCYGW